MEVSLKEVISDYTLSTGLAWESSDEGGTATFRVTAKDKRYSLVIQVSSNTVSVGVSNSSRWLCFDKVVLPYVSRSTGTTRDIKQARSDIELFVKRFIGTNQIDVSMFPVKDSSNIGYVTSLVKKYFDNVSVNTTERVGKYEISYDKGHRKILLKYSLKTSKFEIKVLVDNKVVYENIVWNKLFESKDTFSRYAEKLIKNIKSSETEIFRYN